MISFPGVFCESSDKLLIPLPLCRLLTHLEKKNLTCEDKGVYNTK